MRFMKYAGLENTVKDLPYQDGNLHVRKHELYEEKSFITVVVYLNDLYDFHEYEHVDDILHEEPIDVCGGGRIEFNEGLHT